MEEVSTLQLPEKAEMYLQQLMDRNNEGLRIEQERMGLAALADLSEHQPLVRAKALRPLGRLL